MQIMHCHTTQLDGPQLCSTNYQENSRSAPWLAAQTAATTRPPAPCGPHMLCLHNTSMLFKSRGARLSDLANSTDGVGRHAPQRRQRQQAVITRAAGLHELARVRAAPDHTALLLIPTAPLQKLPQAAGYMCSAASRLCCDLHTAGSKLLFGPKTGRLSTLSLGNPDFA